MNTMNSLLYPLHEMQRDVIKPIAAWSEVMANALTHSLNPWANLSFNRRIAAGYGLLNRLGKDYEKPQWDLNETTVNGYTVPISIDTVVTKPFCKLLHFRKVISESVGAQVDIKQQPNILIVAPLSGHYATLLRDTVRSLMGDHNVYITDWIDARSVPVSEGAFHLDDYIAYVMEFIRGLDAKHSGIHLISVCQPTVPVLAAVSIMATLNDPVVPRSMTLMGGPIDTRANPTSVNTLAKNKSYDWFKQNVIHSVPNNYPGAGRKVYPGFLQHTGFVAMNPDKHLRSHWDYFVDLIEGDEHDIDAHRRFYDEYNAVLDLDANYYLDTIKTVFQDHALPNGTWDVQVNGQTVRVNPSDIKKTALMTIEGELDDISGSGQTQAAQGLCANIPETRKEHFTALQCGHYGIFSGRRWREMISPKLSAFIKANNEVYSNPLVVVKDDVNNNVLFNK